nr:hypothetical protein [uncultured Caldimonas sp.]
MDRSGQEQSMPVMRLQVEIDSNIYPELYASLRAIESPHGQGERMRQLAASGLVWEAVRMQAPTAAPAPPPQAVGEPPRAPAVLRSVPVLMDVIDEAGSPKPLDDMPRSAPAEDAPPLPPPLDSGVHKPGARSARMRRMVDRGLFKNG